MPRSPVRVMQLVGELARALGPLSLTHLAETLALPKTSVLSLLRALAAAGYVAQDRAGYSLGTQTLALGAAIARQIRFQPAMHDVLDRLSRATGETTQYGVLAADGPVALCVDMVESTQLLRYALTIGLRRPLYCTSIGKLILAHQSAAWLEGYFAGTLLERFTEYTPSGPDAILAQLPQIRSSGLSISHDQMILGASGISAAVYDGAGRFAGGLTIAAPTPRMQAHRAEWCRLVLAAAREASAICGYAGAPYPPA